MSDAVAVPSRRPWQLMIALLALVAFALLGLGAAFLPQDLSGAVIARLQALGSSPWAVPAGIAGFVVLACLGAPQLMLITGLVAVFGPWAGFLYSWLAKLISCALGFAMGRAFGADLLRRRASSELARVMDYLAKRGFLASALIRIVPTVPSVLVNLAAGCVAIRFRDYIAGTALGSIPKMALTAFAGHALIEGLGGANLTAWIALAAALLALTGVTWWGRRWARGIAIGKEDQSGAGKPFA